MPEADVNEYSNPGLREYKIRLPENGLMASPAFNLVLTKQFHQGEFGIFVAVAPNLGHHGRAFHFCEDIWHSSSTRCGGDQFNQAAQRGDPI